MGWGLSVGICLEGETAVGKRLLLAGQAPDRDGGWRGVEGACIAYAV